MEADDVGTGCKLPTQTQEGRARCFCGAEIDIASMDGHVTAAHMTETAMCNLFNYDQSKRDRRPLPGDEPFYLFFPTRNVIIRRRPWIGTI
jgi:hypothetical protein